MHLRVEIQFLPRLNGPLHYAETVPQTRTFDAETVPPSYSSFLYNPIVGHYPCGIKINSSSAEGPIHFNPTPFPMINSNTLSADPLAGTPIRP